jgi:D-alanine-D-alanine ligase
VSIPKNKQEFEAGITLALSKSDGIEHDLIIEKYIEGREFCVGILDNQPLPPIEIIPNEGWFDYEKKYQSGLTQEICPADIPAELAQRMQEAALKIHNVLRLGFYSRIDFKVDRDGNIFCLEANTLPGMTPNSLFPKEAAAAGIAYADLCDRIVTNGQSRR